MARKLSRERFWPGWPEEAIINVHATITGYLLMGVRGLGLLVITWSTVVLLGDVSLLGSKDFWCLTAITLAQAARVFEAAAPTNATLDGNITTQLSFLSGFVLSISWRLCGVWGAPLYVVVGVVLLAVYIIILLLFKFGLLASFFISMVRLIQRDYGEAARTKRKAALDILYSLALLQGLLFLIRVGIWQNITQYNRPNRYIEAVAKLYKFIETNTGRKQLGFIVDYIHKATKAWDKNPIMSFRGRMNLVTYAVDELKWEAAKNCVAGARILDALIRLQDPVLPYDPWMSLVLVEQRVLMKQLLCGSASSPHLLRKLLHALGPRNQYGKETRAHAARIVAFIAHDIDLEQFPGVLRHVRSLLMASPDVSADSQLETYELDWKIETFDDIYRRRDPPRGNPEQGGKEARSSYHQELVVLGLRILQRLASSSDRNCMIMANNKGLLNMVMAPLTSDIIHRVGHGDWSKSVVKGSLRVLLQLGSGQGQPAKDRRGEILESYKAIQKILYGIVGCNECATDVKNIALRTLMVFSKDDPSSMIPEDRENFIKEMVRGFTLDNSDDSFKLRAGDALAELSRVSKDISLIILKADGNAAVSSVVYVLLRAGNMLCRIRAAEILDSLFGHCNSAGDDDYYFYLDDKLKESMTDSMRQLLQEILACEPAGEGARSMRRNGRFFSRHGDIEDQREDVSRARATGQEGGTSSEQDNKRKLRAAMLSLCVKVCDTFAIHFDALPGGRVATRFTEMVERNAQPTPDSLTILKQTCKMAMWMVTRSICYGDDDLNSLIESLSKASEAMVDMEISMIFASSYYATETTQPDPNSC